VSALPLLAAAALLSLALLRGRAALRAPASSSLAMFVGALSVRLLWVPVRRHEYDGHEAEHLSWFLGERTPGAGDTLAYPLMQWWWWLWGLLLPADERLPIFLSALVGALGVAIVAGGVGTLAGRRAGWLAGILLSLHPTHAAWSSSAYNVILPHTLGWLSVVLVLLWERREEPVLAYAAIAAGVLACAGRMETIVYALPAALLIASSGRLREWLLPALIGTILTIAAALPVLGSGPLPGSEERWSSLVLNLPILDFHAPLSGLLPLLCLALLSVGAWRRSPAVTTALLATVAANHVLMSTFSDYGARHTLPALLALGWCGGVGALALGRVGLVCWGVLAVLLCGGMADLRERYYASEEAFEAELSQAPWASLPRIAARPGVSEGCGWIAEDERVSVDPARSHFNLLDAAEVASLRGEGGCLYWCADIQDWRWSSRGVRSRARRLERMYVLRPTAVVVEQSSGYSCLVMWVGERDFRPWPFVAEWHGRGHPADTFLP
jgi:hypothetical protein